MQAALATAEQRGADYLREREREVVKKIARTRQRSLGNIRRVSRRVKSARPMIGAGEEALTP